MSLDPAAERELRSLLAARSAALVAGDAGFFERLLADEFTYVSSGGQVFGRAEYLEFFLRSGRMRWRSQELDELAMRGHGEVIVLTCRIHDQARFDGEEFDGWFRSTQVFARAADGWRYVAGHTTAIAP